MNQAILGADFLHDNGLLVDLGGKRQVHSAMYATITVPSIMCLPVPLAVTKPPQVNSAYTNLLTSRPKFTELNFHKGSIPHGVKFLLTLVSVLLSTHQIGICHPTNSLSPRLHSERWRAIGLSGASPANGHSHSILHPSLVVVGAHVEILYASKAASRLTVTRCPTSKTLLVNFWAKQFSRR